MVLNTVSGGRIVLKSKRSRGRSQKIGVKRYEEMIYNS
jgi:hypothetical protein